MSKHTPGKWVVSSSTLVCVDYPKLKIICNTLPILYEEIQEENISMSQATANARLIAQSPAMLEALKDAIQTVEFEGHPLRPWHSKARAIIRAAEGGE